MCSAGHLTFLAPQIIMTTRRDTSIPKMLPCAVLCLVAQSCLTLCDPMDCSQPGSSAHGDSPGKNTGVGCHALLQGIFPTQGSNPCLLYCRWILYHLSHQGSPRILEWVAYPFSRGSSQPRKTNGGLPRCRRILYQLSYEGSPLKMNTICIMSWWGKA